MAEAVRQTADSGEDIQSDQYGGNRKYTEIHEYLFAVECLLHPFRQQKIIKCKVHSEQQHKDGHHHLDIRAVSGHAVRPDAKAARSCRSKYRAERIKQRHFPKKQKDHFQHGHRQIDPIQEKSRFLHSGNQFAHAGARALSPHQVHGLPAGKGHNLKDEYQNPHSSQPVGEAAPEHHAAREGFHIHQDA